MLSCCQIHFNCQWFDQQKAEKVFTDLMRFLSPFVPSAPWRGLWMSCSKKTSQIQRLRFKWSQVKSSIRANEHFQSAHKYSFKEHCCSPCASYTSWRSFLQWVHSLQNKNRTGVGNDALIHLKGSNAPTCKFSLSGSDKSQQPFTKELFSEQCACVHAHTEHKATVVGVCVQL